MTPCQCTCISYQLRIKRHEITALYCIYLAPTFTAVDSNGDAIITVTPPAKAAPEIVYYKISHKIVGADDTWVQNEAASAITLPNMACRKLYIRVRAMYLGGKGGPNSPSKALNVSYGNTSKKAFLIQ